MKFGMFGKLMAGIVVDADADPVVAASAAVNDLYCDDEDDDEEEEEE